MGEPGFGGEPMSELSNKLNGHSKNDELRTPRYLWDWLDRRFRFDLDAAASHENARTDLYCTVDGTYDRHLGLGAGLGEGPYRCGAGDGLTQPWLNSRVYVNPPYSRPLLGQFIEKAIAERDNAEIIVMLVKCDTSTENYRMLERNAHIEHLRRVRYEDENGKLLPAATFASCLAIIRPTEPRS